MSKTQSIVNHPSVMTHHEDHDDDKSSRGRHDNISESRGREEDRVSSDVHRDHDRDRRESSHDDKNDGDFFKKKNIRPRTQSFQSVLSTASLKSLNPQHSVSTLQPLTNQSQSQSQTHTPSQTSTSAQNHKQRQKSSQQLGMLPKRNNSTISNSSKNFQSFIQAPVLSSIVPPEVEIGKQLPFNHAQIHQDPPKEADENHLHQPSIATTPSPADQPQPNQNYYDTYDDDTIIQQQNLTLNALKKLSLSPLPKIDKDLKRKQSAGSIITASNAMANTINSSNNHSANNNNHINNNTSNNNHEKPENQPYQPAEVDLSSFASLTRQPNRLPKSPVDANLNTTTSQSNNSNPHSTIKPNTNSNTNSPLVPTPQTFSPHSYENNPTGSQGKGPAAIGTSAMSGLSNVGGNLPNTNSDHNIGSQGWKAEMAYHNEVHKNQLKIQTNFKNSLINELNGRRKSPLINQVNTLPYHNQSGQQLPSQPPHHQTSQPQSESAAQSQSQSQQQYQPQSHNPNLNNNHHQHQPQQYSGQSINGGLLTPNGNHGKNYSNSIQQIKNLRSPMYVPAVLRHTDSSSLKSFDSNRSTDSISSAFKSYLPFTSFKSYEYYLRQPPTKKHWVKDESVYKCSHPGCNKEFNFFERRHHCRKCGGVYCKIHTSHFLYINHLAQFTTGGRGTLSRVCDGCIEEYNEFVKNEFQLYQNDLNTGGPDNAGAPGTNLNTYDNNTDASIKASHTSPVIYSHSGTNTGTNSPGLNINSGNNSTINSPGLSGTTSPNGNTNDDSNDHKPSIYVNKNLNKKYLDEDQPVGSVPANWSWSSF